MRRLLTSMRREDVTVHGFRSSFRDWTAECTAYPREVCEMALAHAVGDQTEAAYLEAAIEDGDQGALMVALRHVAQARGGVAEMARRSHLSREATYRMLSKDGNPELRSFTTLLAGAGLRLSIKPTDSRVKKAA